MKMLLLLSLVSLLACSSSPVLLAPAPLPLPGGDILLLDRIHLGDGLADKQAFVFDPFPPPRTRWIPMRASGRARPLGTLPRGRPPPGRRYQ